MKIIRPNKFIAKPYQDFLYKFVFGIYCPVYIKKYAELPESPFLACSNHCSHIDTPLIIYASGCQFKDFSVVAAQDLFFNTRNANSIYTRIFNLIPIDRKASHKSIVSTVKRCKRAIRAGQKILAYPEGTRSSNGVMGKFKKGVSMLAFQLQIPIVPFYIKDSFKRMPKKNSFLVRPGRIEVHIDAPMDLAVYQGLSNREAYDKITDDLYQRINRMRQMAEKAC